MSGLLSVLVPMAVFIVVVALALWIGLHVTTKGQAASAAAFWLRVSTVANGTGKLTLQGAAYSGGFGVSAPLATLVIDRSEAKIHAPLIFDVTFRRDEIVRVVWRRGLLQQGLRFETATGAFDHIAFRPLSKRPALEALRQLGW